MGDPLADCEDALVAHWSQLGRLPGGRRHEEDGLVWFETPVRHLPYNGVPRSRLPPGTADSVIARVLERLRAREADVWWAVHPTATPGDLGARLEAAGLPPVERMTFMALDLAGRPAPAATRSAEVAPVAGEDALRAYSELTFAYWEVPEDERDAVAALHRAVLDQRLPGVPYLAHLGGRAVGKAYLSFPGPPGVASLYGMSVLPEARGRGVAGALTQTLLRAAADRGCHRFVLHATDMAVATYERAGFETCGTATVHASAPLWDDG